MKQARSNDQINLHDLLIDVQKAREEIAEKGLPEKFQPFAKALRQAVQQVRRATFEAALRGTLELPLEPARLGVRKETWDGKMRDYIKPLIAFADAVSTAAAQAAISGFGPLSPIAKQYAMAARSHSGMRAQKGRKANGGGRRRTVRWATAAAEIWPRNFRLTPEDMLQKLEVRQVLRIEGDHVVPLDSHGLETMEKIPIMKFRSRLRTLKNRLKTQNLS